MKPTKEPVSRLSIFRLCMLLVAILFVGVVVRVGVVSYFCGPPPVTYPTMDEMNFRELAVNILDYRTFAAWTEGFFTASTRAPVYPILVASAYSISNSRGHAIPKLLNLFLDMLNILLMFVLGYALFGTRFALAASSFYAVFGHAPYFMAISSPHILGLTLLLSVCIAIIPLQRFYFPSVMVLSILYALLLHARPVFLVSLPFLVPAVWLQISAHPENSPRHRSVWRAVSADPVKKSLKSLLPVVIVLLLCLPWGIRNYRLQKTVVPVCVIPGWHIASNENKDMALSIQYLVEQIYRPERREFSEGDYFRVARAKMSRAFLDNPVSFTSFGLLRLAAGWAPQNPLRRFYNPKAYVFPVRIFDGLLLPLPDFEGLIYILVASGALALTLSFKSTLRAWAGIICRARSIIAVALGYSLVHILGIPLVAYLFLIEPILAVLFLAAISCHIGFVFRRSPVMRRYLLELRSFLRTSHPPVKPRSGLLCLLAASSTLAILAALMAVPFIGDCPQPRKNNYFALLQPQGILNYCQLRNLQWENHSRIPEGTVVTTQGVVRYSLEGFKFVVDDYYAVSDPEFSAARLFVRYGGKETPLGTGDVRMNFHRIPPPEDEQVVIVRGEAKAGLFGEIIINVSSYEMK
ncbi:MAG: hypothetical protein JW808_04415 [Victivallales bacterium]|nr:hypothetical protein [Victivallales bacterium]